MTSGLWFRRFRWGHPSRGHRTLAFEPLPPHRKVALGLCAGIFATLACSPPPPAAPEGERAIVTMTRIDPGAESVVEPASSALSPAASATLTARVGSPLAVRKRGTTTEQPLALPSVLAASRSAIFAFGRTTTSWVVRVVSTKTRPYVYSEPLTVTAAYPDDEPPAAITEGDNALFAISQKSGVPGRYFRVESTGKGDSGKPDINAWRVVEAVPKTGAGAEPARLGSVTTLLGFKSFVGVVARDGESIGYARLAHGGGFIEGSSRTLGKTIVPKPPSKSRSPRATIEEDKILLAFDGEEIAGALESPGTTPAERAAPKPGVYVRRFEPNGQPASPLRRLTRPGFTAHTLDVVVELGACAVLADTPEGFEMFRFVRKGDDLPPYGGGLHLASGVADVALSADVFGTLAVTTEKLLRIGPGVKIVASPLGFSAGGAGRFERVRVATEGNYGAVTLFDTKSPFGPLPTLARIEGEKMGSPLPNPWSGPPPERLVFATMEGSSGLVVVQEGAQVFAAELEIGTTEGSPLTVKEPSQVTFDLALLDQLMPPDYGHSRATKAMGEWFGALRDGRFLRLTGKLAGGLLDPGYPPTSRRDGQRVFLPSAGKSDRLRVVYVPPSERIEPLSTMSFDASGVASPWVEVPGSARHYGVLGETRVQSTPRLEGGLYFLTSSGPKVSSVAQLYELFSLDPTGKLEPVPLLEPAPIQEIAFAPTLEGAAIVASLTGKGTAMRSLDGGGWFESGLFSTVRKRGEGPLLRDRAGLSVLPGRTLPLASTAIDEAEARCRAIMPVMVKGQRRLVMGCEEPVEGAPLSTRVVVRDVRFD